MNKTLPTLLAIVVAALLQVGLAPHMSIFGVVPNLLLLVVITLGLVEGSKAGCAAGFTAGLIFDLLGSSPIGPGALVMCIVGYIAGTLQENLFAEGWLLPVTAVFVAGLLAEGAYGLMLSLLGEGTSFWRAFVSIILPSAVYGTALAVLFYPWLARFLKTDPAMTTFKRLA